MRAKYPVEDVLFAGGDGFEELVGAAHVFGLFLFVIKLIQ